MATINVPSARNSIQAGINAASNGDTVLVAAGTYSESITINKNITVKTTANARIKGSGGTLVNITASGATFDGFTVEHTQTRGGRDNLVQVENNNVTIKDCTIYCSAINNRDQANANRRAGDRRAGIRIGSDRKNFLIQDCEIKQICFGVHMPGGTTGSGGVIRGCNIHHTVQSPIVIQSSNKNPGLLIENCNLSYAYIEDGIQWQQGSNKSATDNYNTYVRNCTLIGNSENALDFKGANNVVIEGCVITRTIGSNDGSYSGWNTSSYSSVFIGSRGNCKNVIFRNNVVYNSAPAVFQSGDNWKSYNNTIIYNNYWHTGPNANVGSGSVGFHQRSVPNIGTKNNIVGGHRKCQIVATLGNGLDLDYNLYFKGTSPGSDKVGATGTISHRAGTPMTWSAWKSKVQSSGGVSGKEAHSMYVANHSQVGFANVPAEPFGMPNEYDFTVTSSSPAYRSGGPLTKVTASSSGKTIRVEDATWFSDGMGCTQGDTITIGSQSVRITGISGNTLNLDRSVNANNGDPVFWGATNRPHIGVIDVDAPSGAYIVADFEAQPQEGVAPLEVRFTDRSSSTNGIRTWQWKVNGREFAQTQNPSYRFETPGAYTVELVVSGPDGSDAITRQDFIIVTPEVTPGEITADFAAEPVSGVLPLDVRFEDRSFATNGIKSWSWTVNGEEFSRVENPTYRFTKAGLYTIALTVTGPDGTDTAVRQNLITVTEDIAVPQIIADFVAAPLIGTAPFEVVFEDRSVATNGIDTWRWQVNGEEFSQEQNATYRFAAPGKYSIALTIAGPDGSDTIVKSDLITVTEDGVIVPPESTLVNGAFSEGTTGWEWHTSGIATWEVVNGIAQIDVTSTADNTQLYQRGIQVQAGQRYRFGAQLFCESGEVAVLMRVMTHDAPYDKVFNESVVVTPEVQRFEFIETAPFTNNNMRVTFLITSPGKLYLDNVVFAPADEPIVPIAADFDLTPVFGFAPLEVQFQDRSVPQGGIDAWTWKVNGVLVSTEQNPSYLLSEPGTYTIELTVEGANGLDSLQKADAITVLARPTDRRELDLIRTGAAIGIGIGIG